MNSLNCIFIITAFCVSQLAVSQNPGGISGSQHWYKADDILSSGGNVTQLNDLSGNSHDASQSDGSEQPTTATNVINGNDVIRFNGTSQYLPIAKKSYNGTGSINDLSVFVVYNTSNSSGGTNSNWSFIDYDKSDNYNVYVGGNGKVGFSYTTPVAGTITRLSSSTNNDQGIPRLATALFDNTLTNDTKVRVNGSSEIDDNIVTVGDGIGRGRNTRFGIIGDGSESSTFDANRNNRYYDGDIAEIIVYENESLDINEINKVETYLGVKYGLHLDHDFISSNDDVIWDQSNNSLYHHLVTSIGRDNASGLNQNKSINQDGGLIEIEANSSLSDESFLIWGNNNGLVDLGISNKPSSCIYNLERVWKTEIANSIPSTDVSVDFSQLGLAADYGASNVELIISSSDDFTTGSVTTIVASSFDGTTATFENVNFVDGGYFSFCFNKIIVKQLFSDATFWLKSDEDVYDNNNATDPINENEGINRWLDQTGNNHFARNRISQPRYDEVDVPLNFLPTVDFSANSGMFSISNSSSINVGSFYKKSAFVAIRTGSDINTTQTIYEQGGRTNGLNLYINNGDLYFGTWTSSWEQYVSHSISPNTEYVIGLVYSGNATNTGLMQLYVNGVIVNSINTGVGFLPSHTGGVGIGGTYNDTQFHTGDRAGTGDSFSGQLSEIIYWDGQTLTEIEARVVSSYFALRYGVTLTGDYLSTSLQPIWIASSNSVYHNDVFGLGRDDESMFDQRRSKSENDGSFLDIRHSSSYTEDTSYAIFGHDNGVLSWSSTGTPNPAIELIGRIWKVVVDGNGSSFFNISLDTTQISTPNSCGTQIVAIVNDNTDFSSGAQIYELTFDSDVYKLTSNITLNDGQFITFGLVSHVTDQDGLFNVGSTWLSGVSPKNGESFRISENHNIIINDNVSVCDITLEDNASLDLSTNTIEITQGTITLNSNSSVNKGTSTVIYSNSVNQDIAGIDYYNLHVDNGATKSVTSNASVENDLYVGASTVLNANNNLTLLSSSTNTARLLELPTGASVTGNMHVQRWVGATSRRWWQMSSPVQNATLEEWHDDIPITGDFPTSDDLGGSNFASIKWYDETDPGASSADGWVDAPVNGFDESIAVGRGYRVYIRQSPTEALNDTVISVTGIPNQGLIDLGVSYEDAGGLDAAGWCFVANPYPSAIDWDAASWTKTRVDDAIYVWDALNNRYTSYVGGIGVNGGTSEIASSQGFWVRTTGNNPRLRTSESVKSTNEVFFYREPQKVIYVNIEEGDYKSNTALRFGSDFTESYDIDKDAYYWGGSYPVNIGTINSDNKYFSINSLPLNEDLEIPLYVYHKNDKNKEFKLSFEGIEGVDDHSIFTLKDRYKNTETVIDNSTEYKFKFDGNSNSSGVNRFVLKKKTNILLNVDKEEVHDKLFLYPTVLSRGETMFISNDKVVETINVCSSSGTLLRSETNQNRISLNLDSGCYFVSLRTNNNKVIKKVIIK